MTSSVEQSIDRPDAATPRGMALDRPRLGLPRRIVGKRRSIKFWLRWLAIACIIPGWAATAFFIVESYEHALETRKADTVATARALMLAVDGEVSRVRTVLQVLATSRALAAGDFADFYIQAQEALQAAIASNVVLVDPSGQQIVDTLKPVGAPLPMGTPIGLRLGFEGDGQALIGRGIVRWAVRGDGQIGIEITHVDAAHRAWAVATTERNAMRGFIPRTSAQPAAGDED